MNYKKNQYFIDNVSINKIVNKYGSPIYCYSLKRLKENINNFKKNFKGINSLVCFSVKSNSNLKILKEIKSKGLGADVVSKGELIKALNAGIKPNKIVFSGVGKSFEEITFAIQKNILLINSESESEIKVIENVAKSKKKKINIGIRLNPNIDAKTLKKISTGKSEDKFGLSENKVLKLLNEYRNSKYINIECLSVHIGSQITSHVPYQKTLNVLKNLINKSKYNFKYIDLVVEMGIEYIKNSKKLNYKNITHL